jgi:hypothetical protein
MVSPVLYHALGNWQQAVACLSMVGWLTGVLHRSPPDCDVACAFGGAAGLLVNSIAIKQTGGYILPINIITAAAALGLLLCGMLARSGKRV